MYPLRKMEETDLQQVVKIIREDENFLGGVHYPSLRDSIKYGKGFVYVDFGLVVGFMDLYLRKRDQGWTLKQIGVLREYQRRGIASTCLHFLQNYLNLPGPTRVRVRQDNVKMIGLLRKEGFTLKETKPGKNIPVCTFER